MSSRSPVTSTVRDVPLLDDESPYPDPELGAVGGARDEPLGRVS
ncbi:hypothetical protein [Streptomyces sp. 7N604]